VALSRYFYYDKATDISETMIYYINYALESTKNQGFSQESCFIKKISVALSIYFHHDKATDISEIPPSIVKFYDN
jgi:hypothetical protein